MMRTILPFLCGAQLGAHASGHGPAGGGAGGAAGGQAGADAAEDDLPPGFVAPGPTNIDEHAERWYLDEDPAIYVVASGDTMVGITKTYLDPTGGRWREIWDLNRDLVPNPDELLIGDELIMPDEAAENMRRWLGQGGDPSVLPSRTEPGAGDVVRRWWPAGVGAAAVAAALYAMS